MSNWLNLKATSLHPALTIKHKHAYPTQLAGTKDTKCLTLVSPACIWSDPDTLNLSTTYYNTGHMTVSITDSILSSVYVCACTHACMYVHVCRSPSPLKSAVQSVNGCDPLKMHLWPSGISAPKPTCHCQARHPTPYSTINAAGPWTRTKRWVDMPLRSILFQDVTRVAFINLTLLACQANVAVNGPGLCLCAPC